jgi:hypothetical protein
MGEKRSLMNQSAEQFAFSKINRITKEDCERAICF